MIIPYNEIKKNTQKKGVIMPMSLSHKSVKKHNKKLPSNVTKNKILDFSVTRVQVVK